MKKPRRTAVSLRAIYFQREPIEPRHYEMLTCADFEFKDARANRSHYGITYSSTGRLSRLLFTARHYQHIQIRPWLSGDIGWEASFPREVGHDEEE